MREVKEENLIAFIYSNEDPYIAELKEGTTNYFLEGYLNINNSLWYGYDQPSANEPCSKRKPTEKEIAWYKACLKVGRFVNWEDKYLPVPNHKFKWF